MKIVELVNKIRIPITNEEADVLGQFNESKQIAKVNKDVLFRKNENGKIYYRKKS
jgi:hypothetical protein